MKAHQTINLDDENQLIVVGTRAWVVDDAGARVSVTWTKETGEAADAFVRRTTDQAHRVITFVSPAN